ncbi:MAG TPA: hypothetical protein VFZ52_19540 [Chryseolinea sp.]
MNCNLFRCTSGMALLIFLELYAILGLMANLYDRPAQSDFAEKTIISQRAATDECVSANDFSLTHKNGRDENIHHTFVYTLQAERLIRESIFDREKILILTIRLIRFTHQGYQTSLPPWWHPSIPIAHRRLII